MINQKKFNTAEEFLIDWWTRFYLVAVKFNASQVKPHTIKTRGLFAAVPCECNTESCCGWKLVVKRKPISID